MNELVEAVLQAGKIAAALRTLVTLGRDCVKLSLRLIRRVRRRPPSAADAGMRLVKREGRNWYLDS